tara:strand:- start:553 stop:702 length:150 start_codon:yes stop_codon:yes gene_type:complete
MNPLLKGSLSKKEFADKYYYIYKEAFKYDKATLNIFNDLLKYPKNKRSI